MKLEGLKLGRLSSPQLTKVIGVIELIICMHFTAQAYGSKSNFQFSDTLNKPPSTLDSATVKADYDSYRIAIGAGGNWSLPNTEGPFAWGITFTYQHEFQLFSFRFISSDGTGGPRQPDELVEDLGLLYGIGVHDSSWLIGISTGIEYVDRRWPQFYSFELPTSGAAVVNNSIRTHAFGLPYQLQILLTLTRSFGIGLTVFGNVNQVFSHVGGYFCLQFGKL